MFGRKIWDFYASWYDKLWVQKFVLTPSRALIVKTISHLPPAESILDIGCGIGELCNDLRNKFPETEITGIDPSSKMTARAIQLYAQNDINFMCGLAENLPENKTYDIIVSTHAFPYVADQAVFLQKVKKLLKPDGRILLIFGNKNNFYDACWLRIVKLTTSKAEYLSVGKTAGLLRSCGFKTGQICRIDTAAFVPSVYMIEGINDI